MYAATQMLTGSRSDEFLFPYSNISNLKLESLFKNWIILTITIIICRLYSPLRSRAYQPTADLISILPQAEVKDIYDKTWAKDTVIRKHPSIYRVE